MTVFDPVNRIQQSAKTASGFGLVLLLLACSQSGSYSDNYDPQTFYNANDITQKVYADGLGIIENNTIFNAIDGEIKQLKVFEKCSAEKNTLNANLRTIINYSSDYCQFRYAVVQNEERLNCFHITDEMEIYDTLDDEDVGMLISNSKGRKQIVSFDTDNDEEEFFTTIKINNISMINCDFK